MDWYRLSIGCVGTRHIVGYFFYATMQIGEAFWGQVEDWDQEEQPWTECAFTLPDDTGRIVFLRQHAHPFLAEFNRQVRFELVSQEPVTLTLPMNTGGSTLINVYLYSNVSSNGSAESFLRFQDRWGEYIVDLKHLNFVTPKDVSSLDSAYLGRFDERNGLLQFIPFSQSPEEKIDQSE